MLIILYLSIYVQKSCHYVLFCRLFENILLILKTGKYHIKQKIKPDNTTKNPKDKLKTQTRRIRRISKIKQIRET